MSDTIKAESTGPVQRLSNGVSVCRQCNLHNISSPLPCEAGPDYVESHEPPPYRYIASGCGVQGGCRRERIYRLGWTQYYPLGALPPDALIVDQITGDMYTVAQMMDIVCEGVRKSAEATGAPT